MLEVWTECVMDIVKTIPILFVVYLVISWMETHMDAVTRVVTSTEPAGPVIGAVRFRSAAFPWAARCCIAADFWRLPR